MVDLFKWPPPPADRHCLVNEIEKFRFAISLVHCFDDFSLNYAFRIPFP